MQQPPNPFLAVLAASQRDGRKPSGTRRDRTRAAAPEAVAARAKRQAESLSERNRFAATMHARGDYATNPHANREALRAAREASEQ